MLLKLSGTVDWSFAKIVIPHRALSTADVCEFAENDKTPTTVL